MRFQHRKGVAVRSSCRPERYLDSAGSLLRRRGARALQQRKIWCPTRVPRSSSESRPAKRTSPVPSPFAQDLASGAAPLPSPSQQSFEVVVHAGFDLVDGGLDGHAVAEPVREAQGLAAEVEMIVFELCRPV